ncbi:MAG: hypothetical protein LJE62_14645 [Silicimonas sp.]|jgi:hypothetical protein|nr:hypothetical protein [Silicimonas sp.]
MPETDLRDDTGIDMIDAAAVLSVSETGRQEKSSLFGHVHRNEDVCLEVSYAMGDVRRVEIFDSNGRLMRSVRAGN